MGISLQKLLKICDYFCPDKVGIDSTTEGSKIYLIGGNKKNELYAIIKSDIPYNGSYQEIYYKEFITALGKPLVSKIYLMEGQICIGPDRINTIGTEFAMKEKIDLIMSDDYSIDDYLKFSYLSGFDYSVFNNLLKKKNDLTVGDNIIPFGIMDLKDSFYFFATDRYLISLVKYNINSLSLSGNLDLSSVELIRFPTYIRKFIDPANDIYMTNIDSYGVYAINQDIYIFTDNIFIEDIMKFSYKTFTKLMFDLPIDLTIKIKDLSKLIKTINEKEEDFYLSIERIKQDNGYIRKIAIGHNVDNMTEVKKIMTAIGKVDDRYKNDRIIIPVKTARLLKALKINKGISYISFNFMQKKIFITDAEDMASSIYINITQQSEIPSN